MKTFGRQFVPDGDRIKSVYLYSAEPGTGKTTTAAALLNEYLTVHYIGSVQRRQQPVEKPVYFLDVNDWQRLYNGFTRKGVPQDVAEVNSREYYRREGIASRTPFLVMDDIGVRECTEGFRGDIHALINERVTSRLPTVYTSNVPLSELASVYDRRLADRVRDMCINLTFQGESKRGIR
ncbi:DNA replication protein [Paenibacillus sp. NPDC057967]|uniref:DNA replication protein n=1 Tax=Paenibacillus sp. NPDC057967 TaxID=3346293 RepID=UPI0036D99954